MPDTPNIAIMLIRFPTATETVVAQLGAEVGLDFFCFGLCRFTVADMLPQDGGYPLYGLTLTLPVEVCSDRWPPLHASGRESLRDLVNQKLTSVDGLWIRGLSS